MTMHEGHRKRLRQRFRQEGLEGFAPHEALELLLCYGRARGDVNPLAHQLLDTFGSLRGVLEADPRQLAAVPGVGEETATLLALMVPMFRRYSLCLCEESPYLRTTEEARSYCAALLAGCRGERFYVVCLDGQGRVMGRRLIAEGTADEVAAYPRLVAECALQQNAASLVLCHNHPSGALEPSPEDVALTRRLRRTLGELGVQVLDHVIVAAGSAVSMAERGDLAPETPSLIPPDGRLHVRVPRRGKQ